MLLIAHIMLASERGRDIFIDGIQSSLDKNEKEELDAAMVVDA